MGKTAEKMVLGIDVGGSKIASGLVDLAGNVRDRRVEETDQSSDSSAVAQLRRLIEGYEVQETGTTVGIGVPGIVDPATGSVWAPNVRGWDQVRLSDLLSPTAEVPIVVESDRNTAVLGELLFGAARGRADVVSLILGTGIGAGIVAGGRLVRGCHEIAGAVGWMPVVFRGRVHHFESVAAGPAISRIATKQGLPGSLPRLAQLAREGCDDARCLFDEVGEVVGQALSVLVSALNPEIIMVGGGVSNLWDLLEDSARKSMIRWAQPIASGKVELVVSRLGLDAGILGAAAAARMEGKKGHER